MLFLWLCGAVFAQELSVSSFQRMDRDLLARTKGRFDLNDVPCAIVRVSVPDVKSYTFEGNIIGDVVYKPGEALVYMTRGSRNITIKSDKSGTMKYEFGERLEKQVVYKMTLRFIQSDDNKIRTLVMPVVGLGEANSFGAMIGVVKKYGFYVKVKTNLQSETPDLECTGDGLNAEGQTLWFTGEKVTSRMAVTGGLLCRLSHPLYLYVGGGYGYKKLAWETAEGTWAENTDKTYTGPEAELGFILRAKNFAISAGAQSNNFKYVEATVGIGIMF
jgi:opacity protein-like surface antigen